MMKYNKRSFAACNQSVHLNNFCVPITKSTAMLLRGFRFLSKAMDEEKWRKLHLLKVCSNWKVDSWQDSNLRLPACKSSVLTTTPQEYVNIVR